MGYNNGVPVNGVLEAGIIKKYLMAKNFSEGNKDLEHLLWQCWKNGINTISCCAGHPETMEKSIAYIVVELNENSELFLENAISAIMEKNITGIQIDFGISSKVNPTISFYAMDENQKDLLFNLLSSSIGSKKQEYNSVYFDIVSKFKWMAVDLEKSINYSITNSSMSLFIANEGWVIINPDENSAHLSTLLSNKSWDEVLECVETYPVYVDLISLEKLFSLYSESKVRKK